MKGNRWGEARRGRVEERKGLGEENGVNGGVWVLDGGGGVNT